MEEIKEEKNALVREIADKKYEYGFTTDVETDIIPVGLNEDIVRLISQKKHEPEWMLEFRLRAFRHWQTLKQPTWGHVHIPPIDYQAISYYADPLAKKPQNKEIDPELEKTFDKLGIPLEERLALSGTAVDAIMDSVSVKTTFKEKLREKGVIFCSIGEAIQTHPDLVRQYLGTVVPYGDNFFAALNSAVFSDGSFVYIPKGVRCPMELSSYFRINARNTGQFERTLIVADDDSYVSYLEGCTAPMRDENQLHAAIVEIIVMDRAEVKYSTVQNWYPGDEHGRGGVLNLVTKRGDLRGDHSKLSWTQVETGSAITWKYPSCLLRGNDSVAEFYSVAVTNNYQEADTGTKMIHIGKNTRSTIISKGISAGHSQNSYRGLVMATANADNARNYSSCDSLLLGSDCGAHTFPYMDAHNEPRYSSTRRPRPRSRRTSSSTATSVASRWRRPWDSSSTATPRRCSTNCRWSLPSRHRSCSASRWRARWDNASTGHDAARPTKEGGTMRRKMIMGPALAATLLLTALLPSAASTPVPRWTPQPYRQYLIKLEVERDTIAAPSVMLHGAKTKRKVDVSHFKVGPFWVPDPPSLFEQEDEWHDRDRYKKGRILGDLIEDIINIFLL